MALTTAELARLKQELGFPTLLVGADFYIGISSVFEQVIQPYMQSGASTTCATAVTAATTPTPATLTLASATGFAAQNRVVIDVDDRQEIATVQSLASPAITVLLTKAHTGTYPVTVEGGESILRDILGKIAAVKSEMGSTFGVGSLKAVDEVEFYQSGQRTLFGNLGSQLRFWRNELASCLGIENIWERKRAAGSSVSLY